MKNLRSVLFIALTMIMVFAISGCAFNSKDHVKDYVYDSQTGISIKLPEEFTEKNHMMATYWLQSEKTMFFAIKEDFLSLSLISIYPTSSLRDYAEAVIHQNMLAATVKEKDGEIYFTYNASSSGKTFYYHASVKKGTDGFWLCQFACLDSDKQDYESKFFEWATTIVVN